MTHFTENFAAACAALFIASVTFAPLIHVPAAQAASLSVMPILA